MEKLTSEFIVNKLQDVKIAKQTAILLDVSWMDGNMIVIDQTDAVIYCFDLIVKVPQHTYQRGSRTMRPDVIACALHNQVMYKQNGEERG